MLTTPDSPKSRISGDHGVGPKSQNLNRTLSSSLLNLENSGRELTSYNYASHAFPEWKSTPLYIIAHGATSEGEIISTILDTKNIDLTQTKLKEFEDVEILEFENEVNIILAALKRKAKIETLIINSSVNDSAELNPPPPEISRNVEGMANHSFVHTSRYIVILENTLRYLLHLLGLSKLLGAGKERISDRKFKDKIDYLEIEIKMCFLIKKLYNVVKDWFGIFQNLHLREALVLETVQKIKDLNEKYSSPAVGNSAKSLSKIQSQKAIIDAKISEIAELGDEIYCDIKSVVSEYSKTLNFSIKFLNYPEYYFKSNHGLAISPSKNHVLKSVSKSAKRMGLKERKSFRSSELFRGLFPNKQMLDIESRRLKKDLSNCT